ncbi:hypothetical protein IJ674_10365 [bacterium]|nr:hypothetical protein [bacterium]
MGADLFFKIADKSKADEFNAVMGETDIGTRLTKINRMIWVNDKYDIAWAKKNNNKYLIKEFTQYLGHGVYRVSGICEEEIINAGCKTMEDFFELVTQFFELAQTKYEMYFASSSCAFNLDEYYFTIPQIKRITKNGERLKHSTSNPEKYNELMKLLKE